MTDLGHRFSAPINAARPRAARLLEGYSPKLRRRVQLFDHAAFAVWIGLEADPAVITFCERPARTGPAPNDRPIDFWVQRADGEEFMLVARGPSGSELPAEIDGIAVRHVTHAELAATRIWIVNWQRMLPVVNATRALISAGLVKSVKRFVREPTPLARVEQEFATGDPTVVRGTIFEMLRNGQLSAPTLRVQALSLHSVVEPAR